jgi:nucleoside-diphosphate-sugar epimerase
MILVTGAGGFLGSCLIDQLCREGFKVRAGLRNEGQFVLVPSGVEKVVVDIRHKQKVMEATVGCEVIVHLAGKAHAFDERGNDQDYETVNVEGTRNVLDAAVASKAKRMLFISSVKVFGEETQGCVDEGYPANPQTPYGRSKWKAERLVEEYAVKGGMTAVSLRLPMVYGPTKRGNLYRLISAIDRGWFPPLPQLSTSRSMLHVKNFTRAVQACLTVKQFTLPAYIVADAHPYSTTAIYEQICRGLGKPVPHWRVSLGLLKAAAAGGDCIQAMTGRSFPFTSDTLTKLIGSACYSTEALMRDTDFVPELCFERAIPELIEFYRKTVPAC